MVASHRPPMLWEPFVKSFAWPTRSLVRKVMWPWMGEMANGSSRFVTHLAGWEGGREAKLVPFLAAQDTFKAQAEAKYLADELEAKLAPAEVEVDKAEQVAEPLLSFAEACGLCRAARRCGPW
eukprot:Skav209801  [mRNA]  locus=scaffold1201:267040:269586:- [translate_table: standard]